MVAVAVSKNDRLDLGGSRPMAFIWAISTVSTSFA